MDNFNQFTYVGIFLKFYIVSDEMLLINRLSNVIKNCKQGEELLVKVLSPSRHHEDITGPVDAANAFWTKEVLHDEDKGAQNMDQRGELPPIDKKERAKPKNVHGLASTQSHLQT